MSIVQCRECGEEIDGDAAVRLDRCPGCQAPVRIRSKKRRKSRESTESTAESAARARVIVGISAAAGLVVIGAGFAGLLWWLVSSRMAASVAAAEARLQGTVTVLPARKARLPQKPKALVVRGELQTPAQGADRDALTKTFADFLDRLGVDCDPNAREPVMRLRAVGPNMMNVKMLKPTRHGIPAERSTRPYAPPAISMSWTPTVRTSSTDRISAIRWRLPSSSIAM